MDQRELNIRPLSEGIGLGSLKTTQPQTRLQHSQSSSLADSSRDLRSLSTTHATQTQVSARVPNSEHSFPSQKSSNDFEDLPSFDPSMMRQAHAAYAPYSVATEIRQSPKFKWHVMATRFLVGACTDLFVAVFSIFVISWAATIAWNAGESGAFDVSEAFFTVLAIVGSATPIQALIAVLLLLFCWRVGKNIFSK